MTLHSFLWVLPSLTNNPLDFKEEISFPHEDLLKPVPLTISPIEALGFGLGDQRVGDLSITDITDITSITASS